MRTEGWELRLIAEIEAAADRKWKWGEHDCASFALRCVRAMCGPVFDVPVWRNKQQAQRWMATGTTKWLDELMQRRQLAFVQRGDVVTMPGVEEGVAVGIAEGGWAWFANRPRGLVRFPLTNIIGAWEV